jgi:hypothetical protein
MACSDYASWSEFIAQGQFFDALICPFVDSMGVALAGLMVFGTIGLALYIYSGGIELPLVVGIIVGAGVVTQVPAIASQIVGIVLVLGIALAGYVLIMRLNASR